MLGLAFDQYCLGIDGADSAASPNDYCEKETTDRERIELPENQKSLVMTVRQKVGPKKKIIAVLIHGGAIAFDEETLGALDAIVDAFYPGPMGAAVDQQLGSGWALGSKGLFWSSGFGGSGLWLVPSAQTSLHFGAAGIV